MDDHTMRQYVLNMYPESKSWRYRVPRMPPNQIYAIYRRHIMSTPHRDEKVSEPAEIQLELNLKEQQ